MEMYSFVTKMNIKFKRKFLFHSFILIFVRENNTSVSSLVQKYGNHKHDVCKIFIQHICKQKK